ncbi:MAG: CRISPR-associated helicase Cas3' [Chloroflexi bacterium]|nr:CRISPR-associated helicase Cas3' [Chloroflexota bacterium]
MMAHDLYRLFWAKTHRRTGAWHPLICHMIDVAVVVEAMWREVLSPAARRRFSVGLGLDEAAAGRWVVFVAGLHDIGKLSPGFALQEPAMAERIRRSGMPCPTGVRWAAHGAVTTLKLPHILTDQFKMPRGVASSIAVATGGHHGIFAGDRELDALIDADYGTRAWDEARAAVAKELADVLRLPIDAPPTVIQTPTAMMLAGLIAVADWIASNEAYFPYAVPDLAATPAVDAVAYATTARGRAYTALERLGWTGWMPPISPRTFEELFPGKAARPLQVGAALVAESIAEPSLCIVEAPMGEGKTEAAMYLADRWNAVLGQRGCYFALPTQATSNQMFDRVRSFLAERFPHDLVNLQLIHGHAALSAAFQELRMGADQVFQSDRIDGVYADHRVPTDLAGIVAGEWFTYRKRGLLAPFGVGTVDQALLGVLKTPHVFVRLFGLGSKTVIVDEVHAYDTYMTTLLERLLNWLGALRTSVVLLSATLPSARRQSLLQAYAAGLGRPPTGPMPAERYPRITWVTRSVLDARHVVASGQSSKNVTVRWLDGALPEEEGARFLLGEELSHALAAGGCAVVICNTVHRAQQVYRALKPFFGGVADDGLPECDLLHARFLFEERDRREKRVILRFGKPDATVTVAEGQTATVRRPWRAVLVATQIVEQSLDLDFDLMVTDLAPVDLVLQRLGRLHRHDRRAHGHRPARLAEPQLWILRPETLDGDVPGFGRGSEAVYDPHVLLRSWLVLKGRQIVELPKDVEPLVEAVYDDAQSCPADLSPALQARWRETRQWLDQDTTREKREALKRWLQPPWFRGELADLTADARAEDAPDFHVEHQALTRLAEPSVSVVFLHGTPEHPSLDAGGREPVELKARPDARQAEQLLRRSLTISDKRVVFDLLRMEPPAGWRRSALLRHERLLTLDDTGRVPVGRHVLHLDENVGLVVESPEGANP